MNSESLTDHIRRHTDCDEIDEERVVTYGKAMFSRNCRGPVHVPTFREAIKTAILDNDGDESLDKVLQNTLHAFGVGTTYSECSAVPMYDMQTVFLKTSV